MTPNIHLDIVSSEAHIFSDAVTMLIATGIMGELGILPGHAPLLTSLKPGNVRLKKINGVEEIYYISGGILEVQPDTITILADTVTRAADIDEAAALQARENAAKMLANRKDNADFSKALVELARTSAQLRTARISRRGDGSGNKSKM